MERFCGVLIEHFAGNFPTWLAPEQVRILPMNDELVPEAQTIEAQLKAARIRCSVDSVADKLGAKIRKAELAKVHMIILGKKKLKRGKFLFALERTKQSLRSLRALSRSFNRQYQPP